MKKNLRSLISLILALVVTSASAGIGCPGLERTAPFTNSIVAGR